MSAEPLRIRTQESDADVSTEDLRLRALEGQEEDPAREAHAALEGALFEVKRVIVGQEGMLERLLVALLAGGHVLLEGVPGLAKTLTIKTVADVLGGSFKRLQFTPDLVPADLVGTRIYRADTGGFDTELGPVFCNFLLADEINRAPAKVQSALLEVMQERQVTIGHETHRVPAPFLVMATQNPIESEGTYPLPEAQVDRFMFKLVVDYPAARDEVAVVERSLVGGADVRQVLDPASLARHQQAARDVYVDRRVMEYAVALTTATREPRRRARLGRVRRLAARLDQPRARRPRAGAAARARLRAADRRARPRARRAAPPDRAHLRGARRRRRRRPRARRRARAGAGAADRAGRGGHATAMSFREPLLLAGLALVPLALLAYWVAQRRRRRYAIRYPAVDVLAGVAGKARGRHLPALLALLALAALAVSLARPERTVAVEQRQGTVMLVHDTSGSMQATDVEPDRLSAARDAARTLVKSLPEEFRLGVVSFNTRVEQVSEPTTDRAQVLRAIEQLKVTGGTAMGDGLQLAINAIRTPVIGTDGRPQRLPGAIVLLSDGASTNGADPRQVARTAARYKIPVYAIALGTPNGKLRQADGSMTPVPPDTATLDSIARTTKGRSFDAPTARDLEAVYANLGKGLATREEKQEVTAAFAGGALALLLAGIVTGLLRTGRLP